MSRGRRLPEVLTEDEQIALLAQLNPKTKTGLRNTCILRVMLDAACEFQRVTNLRLRDVNLNTGKIMVREGKGKKIGLMGWGRNIGAIPEVDRH